MTDVATPTAAWYPDPSGGAALRWWDGAQWTSHVQELAPAPQPAPQPTYLQPQVVTQVVTPAPAAATPSEDERRAHYAAMQAATRDEPSLGVTRGQPSGGQGFGGYSAFTPSNGPASTTTIQAQQFETTMAFQSAGPNKVALRALYVAGLNLALLVYAVFQHYPTYVRLGGAAVGAVTAILALREARSTGRGYVQSIIALGISVVIGAIAVVALVTSFQPVSPRALSPAEYSTSLEVSLLTEINAHWPNTAKSVTCPDEVYVSEGGETECQTIATDGSSHTTSVVLHLDGSYEFSLVTWHKV